jgi:hypothetical protein
MIKLTKTTEKKIAKFTEYLGARFKTIEIASEGAPITVVCHDEEDKEYMVRIVYEPKKSIESIMTTGIRVENIVFYQLYSLVTNNQNVFIMKMFKDGYALFFVNELSPEQITVTEEDTLIGITSALHIENGPASITKIGVPTEQATFNMN